MKYRKFSLLILAAVILFLLPKDNAFCQSYKEQAKKHYEAGNSYYKQGKYKEAREEFKTALYFTELEDKETVEVKKEEPIVKKKSFVSARKSSDYVIGVEDVLYISVWQNKDLDQEVIVRPDGMISFPLVGDVTAAGVTLSDLDEELTGRLEDYIKYPDVSISVRKLGGRKVIVLGEVGSPGVYGVTGKSTILEAVALAKGFSQNAVVSSVILIRGGFNKPKGTRINLNRAILKADMRYNVILQPEDIIYVPKKFIANVNYLVTQILGPVSQGVYTWDTLSNKHN